MNKRKPISKKIRFEVFKRDSFTCQYCGRKSPDVLLEIEHIKPVSKGGTNSIINLTTACVDCNAGKSDITLDDNSFVEKQRKQLEILQERREQLEMMMEWHTGLQDHSNLEVNKFTEYFNKVTTSEISLTEYGVADIKKLIKKYGFQKLLEAVDVLPVKYSDLKPSQKLDKLGGILFFLTASENQKQVLYVNGICRNRFGYYDPTRGKQLIKDVLELYVYEYVCKIAKEAKNWTEWRDAMEDLLLSNHITSNDSNSSIDEDLPW
jgi:hypothetical protein